MALGCAHVQRRWNSYSPSATKGAAGKLNTALLRKLLLDFDIGGSRWLDQFAFGGLITGDMAHLGLYKPAKKRSIPISSAEMYSPPARCFREGALHSGTKNAQLLRGESGARADLGWIPNAI